MLETTGAIAKEQNKNNPPSTHSIIKAILQGCIKVTFNSEATVQQVSHLESGRWGLNPELPGSAAVFHTTRPLSAQFYIFDTHLHECTLPGHPEDPTVTPSPSINTQGVEAGHGCEFNFVRPAQGCQVSGVSRLGRGREVALRREYQLPQPAPTARLLWSH